MQARLLRLSAFLRGGALGAKMPVARRRTDGRDEVSEEDASDPACPAAGVLRLDRGADPMPYLHCPRCRLTLYKPRRLAQASEKCPRCSAPLQHRPRSMFRGARALGSKGRTAPP